APSSVQRGEARRDSFPTMRARVIAGGAFVGCLGVVFSACAGGGADDVARVDGGADAIAFSDGPSPILDGRSPPFPDGPADPAAALRGATFIASCMSDDGVNRTLQEIYLDRTTSWALSPVALACLASKSNGCAALTECFGFRRSSGGGCDAGCVGS